MSYGCAWESVMACRVSLLCQYRTGAVARSMGHLRRNLPPTHVHMRMRVRCACGAEQGGNHGALRNQIGRHVTCLPCAHGGVATSIRLVNRRCHLPSPRAAGCRCQPGGFLTVRIASWGCALKRGDAPDAHPPLRYIENIKQHARNAEPPAGGHPITYLLVFGAQQRNYTADCEPISRANCAYLYTRIVR